MALLSKLSAKLRTAISISPPSSPEPSPTSSQPVSSFGVLTGRKTSGGVATATRPEAHMRSDSLMTYATNTSNASKETIGDGEKKPRRMSRFREELDEGVWGQ